MPRRKKQVEARKDDDEPMEISISINKPETAAGANKKSAKKSSKKKQRGTKRKRKEIESASESESDSSSSYNPSESEAEEQERAKKSTLQIPGQKRERRLSMNHTDSESESDSESSDSSAESDSSSEEASSSESEDEVTLENFRSVEYAKSGRAGCRAGWCFCGGKGTKIPEGELRIGVHKPSPFNDGLMVAWYHLVCFPCVGGKFSIANMKSADEFRGLDDLKASDRKKVKKIFKAGPQKKKKKEKSDKAPPAKKRKTGKGKKKAAKKKPSFVSAPVNEVPQREPLTFVSWNANSIRLRAERNQLKALAKYCDKENVDVLCIQETRTKPIEGDWGKVEKQMAEQGFTAGEWKYYWNHHPRKRYSGTLMAFRAHCLPKNLTCGIKNFSKARVKYHKDDYPNPEDEGRVMVAEWDNFYCVNCYIPVSGIGSLAKLERRKLWDERFVSFVQQLQKTKPVVIVGDFNIARTNEDVTHPKFFSGRFKGLPGFPSFTIQERSDFETMLRKCKLVDTWREEHPDDLRITWGWNVKGFWAGKMMGLDYALVSKSLQKRVVSSIITRKPKYMLDSARSNGCFHSDHCAIKLQLAEGTNDMSVVG